MSRAELADQQIGSTRILRVDGEFIVRAYSHSGKRVPQADYFTADKDDAEKTARVMVRPLPPVTRFVDLSPAEFFRFVPGYTVYEFIGPGSYRSMQGGEVYNQREGWDAAVAPCGRRTSPDDTAELNRPCLPVS